MNLEEKLPGGGSSQKRRTQLPTKRTDTQKKSAYCAPSTRRQWGWGICQQGVLLHSEGREKKSFNTWLQGELKEAIWSMKTAVCKGLKNEWVEGNERFKTFGSRLMKWREKGPQSSSEK